MNLKLPVREGGSNDNTSADVDIRRIRKTPLKRVALSQRVDDFSASV